MPDRAARIVLLTILLSPGACTDGGQDASAEDLADLDLVEVFRIGSVEDPDIGFSRIGPVAVGPDGRIYVGEAEALHVRVYSEDGLLLQVIGRPGEGPGEFGSLSINGLGFLSDTLWVSDWRNRRISLFTPDGIVAATFPAPSVSVAADPPPRTVVVSPSVPGPDGTWESSAAYSVNPLESISFSYPNLVFDRAGAVIDTQGVRTIASPPMGLAVGEIYFDAEQALVSWPLTMNAYVERTTVLREGDDSGDGSVFEVVRTTTSGDTLFHSRVRYTPIAVDDAFIDRVVAAASPRTLETQGAAAVEATLRSLLPRYHPPVSAVVVGEDGSTWLRREDAGGDVRRWLLLAPDGGPLGHINLPRNVRIAWATVDAVITVEPDEFTVPWLVRYRIGG